MRTRTLPFERLVEVLNPSRSLSRHPLFQVMLAFESGTAAAPELPGLGLSPLPIESRGAKFDLSVALTEQRSALGEAQGIGGVRKPNIADWTISSMVEGAQQLANNLAALPQLGERAWKGFQAQRESASLAPAPKTRFANARSSHRVFDWLDMPKPEVSAIRHALGKPKMNDLALTIIAGGLRRYLQAKEELPDKPLIAICPINVRGSGDPLEGGNQVTSMRVPLGTDIADPLERLKAITAASTEGKHQAEELGPTFLPDLMALYPYPIRSALLRGATALAEKRGSPIAMANVVVSNMPPPTGDWYFAGSKFLAWAGNGMLTPGLGLFLIVAGIRTDLSISVTSTRDVLPDPAFFVDCLRESYLEIRDVAGVKAK